MSGVAVDSTRREAAAPTRLRRLVVWVLKRAALVYLVCLVALTLLQNYAIFPGQLLGWLEPPYTPAAGVEPVEVATADGERLFGYYRAPDPGGGLVVSFHGNGMFPGQHAARFETGPWRAHGWGFLCVTYRGYARSSGRPSEAAALRDGEAILALARRRAPFAPILFHGHSLGTAFATALAAEHQGVGLYLEAPFASMSALVADRFPMYPTTALLRDTFRSDLRIVRVRSPIVIVHGTDDPVVPLASGRALASVAGPQARFVALPGDHFAILGARDAEVESAFRPSLPPASR